MAVHHRISQPIGCLLDRGAWRFTFPVLSVLKRIPFGGSRHVSPNKLTVSGPWGQLPWTTRGASYHG